MNESVCHLIECNCILPLYAKVERPVFHKFVVFSVILDEEFVEKYVECNNCSAIHHVTNINTNTVMSDTSKYKALVCTKDDMKYALSSDILDFLTKNDCETYIWEKVSFLLENKIADSIIYNKQHIDNNVICNTLFLEEDGSFKIKKEKFQRDV